MTQQYPPTWQYETSTDSAHAADVAVPEQGSPPDSEDQGKAGAAKEQAAAVGQGAAQAGQQVAAVARDQAQSVVAEAGTQAKDLLGQARSELTEHAGTQQARLAGTLHALGDELKSLSEHDGQKSAATDLVAQASTRSHDVATWLESREPGDLLAEVQDFARRRPGAFLALAAAAGLAAGRLGRGVKDAGSDDASATSADTITDRGAGL